ncbi:hypothetical protein ACFLYW_00190 [Thermodesulfobacteriota bacterium]
MKKGVIKYSVALLVVAALYCFSAAIAWGESCSDCHDGGTAPEFGATAGCIDCHGVHTDCYSCHFEDPIPGENPHHATTYADNGVCEHCHADPRGNPFIENSDDVPIWAAPFPGDNGVESGLNAPTQMACRECHVSFENGSMIVNKFTRSNYVSYADEPYEKTPVHTINNPELAALGQINNYGICFSCHGNTATTVTVWHARPDKHSSSWVLGQNRIEYCTGDRDIIPCNGNNGGLCNDTEPEGLANFLPGRSGGGISDFNLFNQKLTAEDKEGFGYIPAAWDNAECSDAASYQTNYILHDVTCPTGSVCRWISPYTGQQYRKRYETYHPDWEYITVPAVPGNGCNDINDPGCSADRAVPVFASICPMTSEGVEDCPPPPPVLIPEPNTTCSDNCVVTLNWNAVSDPDIAEVGYKVDVDDNADFYSVNHSSNWITSTSFNVSLPTSDTYYWHVTARDNNNPASKSSWSSKDSFTLVIPAQMPGVPTLHWPPNNYDYQVGWPAGQNPLQWNAAANATHYYCEVRRDTPGGPIVRQSGWITATQYNPGDLPDNRWYYWRVKSKSASGVQSAWSVQWRWFDWWW